MERELVAPVEILSVDLRDAAAGDLSAFARIVAEHHDHMARMCFVICGDQDMAQDAVQAAWPIAWQKLASVREPDRLRSWLITIAANEARQALRRQRRHGVVEIEVADVGSLQDDPSRRTARIDLAAALRRISPEDRAILALRHVSGFDATEIGHAMGISASGVRSRLARAAARLRSELGDD
jgi:RNA polymerase sigma-70 factor (ECF subfamily)